MNERVRRHKEIRWIRLRIGISSEIGLREGKEHNAVVTMVPTVAVVAAALGAIAVEEVSEAVASGVVVVDANESMGRF